MLNNPERILSKIATRTHHAPTTAFLELLLEFTCVSLSASQGPFSECGFVLFDLLFYCLSFAKCVPGVSSLVY